MSFFQDMSDFDGEEYYEMNFVPMKGMAFGVGGWFFLISWIFLFWAYVDPTNRVATINRDPPLPWQLLVADSYQKGEWLFSPTSWKWQKLETFDPENETEEVQEVNGVKCWDSHKVVKLELDFLKDHYAILSLSTGLFKLDQNKEKIVVAIVGDVKGDKNDDIEQSVASGASQHDKMINFYRNEHFGTDSLMKTKSVGSMINTINLNAELNTNIVPYRLSQRKLTPKLNSFILLTNQG